ncbi:hypothetical protein ACPPVU_06390 [Mucilaginibacter sp. McL0603]|uniref:hypothetical protein n=1 Tax=Mucilaginibacter sp. McL0603 TaxID=3415670 RepID=UPI003CE6D519
MPNKITIFWKWFEDNNHAFLFTNEVDENIKEQLLSDFLKQLHDYNDKLYFQIGGSPGADQELIITAEGNVEQFESVEKLIAAAPAIPDWKFIPFIQPSNEDNSINFEGAELTRSELWFIPLQSASDPSSIGIRIYVPNYEILKTNDWLDNAVYKMLDTVLGEKSFALDIDYLEIKELTDDLEKDDMIELIDLPRYITWKKKKLNR